VPGATVLGFHGPCIAIPSALVEALSADELDQVILHEHAHVQRRDDWARLAETLLLSVLSIHPAALFVSRALNREREMACDEWVVARTGSPRAYARCLAHAAEVRARMRGRPALVPALIGSRHELLRRVDRVLAMNGRARRRVSLAGATTAVCAMVMMSAQLQTMRGFSEIVEIVFPIDHVQRVQGMQWVQEVQEVRGEQWVRGVQEVRGVQWVQQVQEVRGPLSVQPAPQTLERVRTATLVPDAPIALEAPDSAPIAPTAPIRPIAPGLSTRIFPGAYSLPDAAVASPISQRNQWQALATPGVEIAESARKISVGVASVFSRAGVSLARSF
jgi:BlaR1 peptidase M56